jgi:hydrogenase nickel incorporation protein HypA/HybF
MHELSIALGIVDIAQKEAEKAGATRVDSIELEIGALAGVELDALDFVWPSAVEGSVLENAERKINYIKAVGYCMECEIEFPMEFVYDQCPQCQGYLKNIIKGRELRVKALEVTR